MYKYVNSKLWLLVSDRSLNFYLNWNVVKNFQNPYDWAFSIAKSHNEQIHTETI